MVEEAFDHLDLDATTKSLCFPDQYSVWPVLEGEGIPSENKLIRAVVSGSRDYNSLKSVHPYFDVAS